MPVHCINAYAKQTEKKTETDSKLKKNDNYVTDYWLVYHLLHDDVGFAT